MISKYIIKLGSEIDYHIKNANENKLFECVQKCDNLLKNLKNSNRVSLYYFKGNIFSALRKIRSKESSYLLNWEQQDAISEILAFRMAICESFFERENVVKRCQIKTNLASCLYQMGRIVEAIDQWDLVLLEDSRFAMALATRADGIIYYNQNLHEHNQEIFFLLEALKNYNKALSPRSLWDADYPEYKEIFQSKRKQLEDYLGKVNKKINSNIVRWWDNLKPTEKKYRIWCLNEKLFLNPLNDLNANFIGASDSLHLPPHRYSMEEEPRFVRFYDLLKQEFITARTLFFEYFSSKKNSFYDKKVLLFDHFDGILYGVRYEKLKSSFRIAYSIFDKLSVFINDYFSLGKDPKRVDFRKVWYKKDQVLEDKFVNNKNWFLRAIFLLSKDLFDKDFQSALPEANFLYELRNSIEHRFLSIHDYGIDSIHSDGTLSCVTCDLLEEKTLKILKLSRSVLIYLSLAMHLEENLKKEEKTSNKGKILIMEGVPYRAR